MRLIRTAADAEEVAAEWMRWIGFADAQRTPTGPDGGVDVLATDVVAQVKLYGRPVGRPDLQKLHGAALGKRTVFLAAEGYTDEAVTWAEAVSMALFRFDRQGEPYAVNTLAQRLMDEPVPQISRVQEQRVDGHSRYRASDAQALAIISSNRSGLFNKENGGIGALRPGSISTRIVVDYTHEVGRRRQIRQSSQSTYFSGLGGHPFPLHIPPNAPGLMTVGDVVRPLASSCSGSDVVKDTIDMWDHYCRLQQPSAAKIPTAPSGSGRSRWDCQEHSLVCETRGALSIFVGQLSHPTGARLSVVDGYDGDLLPQVSVEFTKAFAYVVRQLNVTAARQVQLSD